MAKQPTLGAKILLAEDDKSLSSVLMNKLIRRGYQVVLAKDGAEAVQKAVSEQPRLILLDIIMPVKNGFEALEEIKKNPATKKINVVVMSNLGQDSDIAKAKQLGAKDYLIKSNFAINDIVEKTKKYLT
ncbi:MAG TPA: response regulator [bacterium]|nr:response regulator [bacterium]HPN81041.1 response regulator [bacterium]HPW39455.1 response regulator [bacterium]